MMKRYIRAVSLVLLALIVVVGSHLATTISTGTALAQGNKRPAQIALDWGLDNFPYPDWKVSVDESDTRVSSIWQKVGAVIRYSLDSSGKNESVDAITKLIDDKWMAATLVNYDQPITLTRCLIQAYQVFDLSGGSKTDATIKYRMHYWVWSNADGLNEVFAAYTTDQIQELDALSEKLFGTAAHCSATSSATTSPTEEDPTQQTPTAQNTASATVSAQ